MAERGGRRQRRDRKREREEESISEERSPNKSSVKFFRYLFEAASLKVANEKKAADGMKLTLIKYYVLA